MRLLLVVTACLTSVMARGPLEKRGYKCSPLADGRSNCTTSGGAVHYIDLKFNHSVLGDRFVPPLSTTSLPSATASGPVNVTKEKPDNSSIVPGDLSSASLVNDSSQLESSGLEVRVNSSSSSISSSNETRVPPSIDDRTSFSSSVFRTGMRRTETSLLNTEAPRRKSEANGRRSFFWSKVTVPSASQPSKAGVSRVTPAPLLESENNTALFPNETSRLHGRETSELALIVDRRASGSRQPDDQVVSRQSSPTGCCCEEIYDQKNTRELLGKKGWTEKVQRARPHGFALKLCRASVCGDNASVTRCVQKYRNASVTLDLERKRRANVLFTLEDGCECDVRPNDQPKLTSNGSAADLESTAIVQTQFPRTIDSTVNNIADMISDGVVKLASVSKQLFSLVGLSANANNARALALDLDETAGLIERAAGQLLDLNSAVVNASPFPRVHLSSRAVVTRTVTVVDCSQNVATVQSDYKISGVLPIIPSSSPPFSHESSLPNQQSSVSSEDPESSDTETKVYSTPSLNSLNFEWPGIPGPSLLTSTAPSEQLPTFGPSHTISLKILDQKTEISSPTLLPSDSWLPRPALETSGQQTHIDASSPTEILPEKVTVVTKITTLVVFGGVTYTYSADYPSTEVNGDLFSTKPTQFQPQTVTSAYDSISYTTSVVHPPFTTRFLPDYVEETREIDHNTVLKPPIIIHDVKAPSRLPGIVTFTIWDSLTSSSGVGVSSTVISEPARVSTLPSSTQEPQTVSPLDFTTTTIASGGEGTLQGLVPNDTKADQFSSPISSTGNVDDFENSSSQEDKLLGIAKSLVVLKQKMKQCLVNETAETKTIFGARGEEFLSQSLEQQALLMPIWREFAASNILTDLDQNTLQRCLQNLNTSVPLSRVPVKFSRGLKSLPKVSGLLMAVMELSHCMNLQLSCNSLVGQQLQRRLAAAQLIGKILTESRRSELNLLALVDLFVVDSRNTSRLSSDVLQTSLISKISLIKEFERALEWSRSESEGTDTLSLNSLGVVLAYSAKLKPLLKDYITWCITESAGAAASSYASTPGTVEQSSTKKEITSQQNVASISASSIASHTTVVKLLTSTTALSPKPQQRPATFVPFTQMFTNLPQYHPIRLSNNELEQLVFPNSVVR